MFCFVFKSFICYENRIHILQPNKLMVAKMGFSGEDIKRQKDIRYKKLTKSIAAGNRGKSNKLSPAVISTLLASVLGIFIFIVNIHTVEKEFDSANSPSQAKTITPEDNPKPKPIIRQTEMWTKESNYLSSEMCHLGIIKLVTEKMNNGEVHDCFGTDYILCKKSADGLNISFECDHRNYLVEYIEKYK